MTNRQDSSAQIPDEYLSMLPAYEQIKARLKRQIASGVLPPGERLPSESELCKMFGVSRITAARALTELAQAGLVVRKQGVGTFVADSPQLSAGEDRTTKPAIGLMVRQLSAPFDLRVVRGVESVLSQAGYDVVLYNSQRTEEREAEILAELMDNKTCGVVALPLSRPIGNAAYRRFRQSNKPLVLVDMELDGVSYDVVVEDNVRGGYELTSFLLEQGHHRVEFIPSLDLDASTTRDRYRGYRQACQAHGIPVPEACPRSACERRMPISDQIAALKPIFEVTLPPTAVVCSNYSTAAAVDLYLSRHPKLQVDLTFFDSYDAYHLNATPIARMIQFPEQMSAQAAQLLLDRLEMRRTDPAPVRIVLSQELVTHKKAIMYLQGER